MLNYVYVFFGLFSLMTSGIVRNWPFTLCRITHTIVDVLVQRKQEEDPLLRWVPFLLCNLKNVSYHLSLGPQSVAMILM